MLNRTILLVVCVFCYSLYSEWDPAVDLDNDYHIRLGDFSVLADYWLDPAPPLDLDGSPGMYEGDLFVLAAHWLETDPGARIVPDVAGQINPAQLITAADLTPGDVTYAYSNTIAAGLALRSDPAAGSEVPASSVVDYVISLGQQSLVDFVYVDDPGVPGHEGFTGFISRNEITNREYCSFLNELYGQGLITVNNGKVYASDDTTYSTAYIETSASSSFSFISFDGTEFTPLRAQHPVTEISWFGAKAYCDYNDFYLPTEWQWQAVADYDGTYVYGCGTSINTLKANYHSMNPLELDDMPFTAPFNYYGQYGYGLYCMTGNVSEWTDWTDPAFSPTVVGGNWSSPYNECQVTARDRVNPYSTINTLGFRVCR